MHGLRGCCARDSNFKGPSCPSTWPYLSFFSLLDASGLTLYIIQLLAMRSKPIAMHPEVVPWLASTYAIVFLQWVFKTSPIRHGTLCGTTICGYCGISLPFSHIPPHHVRILSSFPKGSIATAPPMLQPHMKLFARRTSTCTCCIQFPSSEFAGTCSCAVPSCP